MGIPSHVAIIMDGNGRWAQRRSLPRREGHKKGVETLKDIVKECNKQGISCLTVYAFSTENWKRPALEVNFLMNLIHKALRSEAEELHKNNVKVKVIGRRKGLSSSLKKNINYIEKLTINNTGLKLNFALNYGGRAEIVDAVKNICQQDIDFNDINEDTINQYLYNPDLPDVELLIRTGGELRVSNFLLWEIAYAELYYTDKCWPEFTRKDFVKALNEFQSRKRKFGGIDGIGEN